MGWVMSKSGMDALKNFNHEDPEIRDNARRIVENELKNYMSYKPIMRRGLFGWLFGRLFHRERNKIEGVMCWPGSVTNEKYAMQPNRWEHFTAGEPQGKLMVNEQLIGKGQENGKA